MRIISGRYKRRQLVSPPGRSTTRPLPDRVRESMFGLLRGHFEDASVLDGFAGVGSFGLEAASRGASHVVMVERDKRVAEVLRQNVEMLGAGEFAQVVVGDALGPAALARCRVPVNIAFLDPPYEMVRDVAGWDRVRQQMTRIAGLLAADGFLIVRTPWPFLQKLPAETHQPRGGRGQRVDEVMEFDSLEDLEREEGKVLDALVGGVEQTLAEGDLSIAGTIGPETHVYGSTAIHLYMCAGAKE